MYHEVLHAWISMSSILFEGEEIHTLHTDSFTSARIFHIEMTFMVARGIYTQWWHCKLADFIYCLRCIQGAWHAGSCSCVDRGFDLTLQRRLGTRYPFIHRVLVFRLREHVHPSYSGNTFNPCPPSTTSILQNLISQSAYLLLSDFRLGFNNHSSIKVVKTISILIRRLGPTTATEPKWNTAGYFKYTNRQCKGLNIQRHLY